MAYLHVVYVPFRLISTWFAWISYRISRNCFFFSNIFPYFGNRPWLEIPFISRNLHWTSKAKHLEQIAKAPPKYRAVSISTGLLSKETPVLRSAILLQPCTSFSRHSLTLHSLITGKTDKKHAILVDLIDDAKVFVTCMTSLGPCLVLRGRNMAD